MIKVSNLDRAMVAETTMHDYCENKEGTYKLYDMAESVITDLIADMCHLLHLDEKIAGCKTPEQIKDILRRAFDHFEAEKWEEEV